MPITELRIAGVRTVGELRLRVEGLTVLIGDNGSGKSTILECCELLRRATGEHFLDELHAIHGGRALLRQGSEEIRLGVTLTVSKGEAAKLEVLLSKDLVGTHLDYDLALSFGGPFASIKAEELAVRPPKRAKVPGPVTLLKRTARGALTISSLDVHWKKEAAHRLKPDSPAGLTVLARRGGYENSNDLDAMGIRLIANALGAIRVHAPFEVTSAWVARATDRRSALRTPALLTPASQLDRLGTNLASAFHALKNGKSPRTWQEALSYVRLGLGERVEDIVTWADPGGGNIGLSLKLRGLDLPIPAAQLSDGMLAYLAFVALVLLHRGQGGLLALDEPDLHLHPQLLMRVLDLLEEAAADTPVLLATHSDRLLDGLRDPASAVALCDLDEKKGTQILRPDAKALARWLERYRGLGDIRGAGHAASVLTKPERS